MKNFEFASDNQAKLLTLRIDGKEYKFNPNTVMVKKAIEKFISVSKPLMKQFENQDSLTDDKLEQLILKSCSLVQETINRMMGKGTYEKIFAGRVLDFDEHQKLMTYIFESISEFLDNEYSHQ